MSAARTSLLVLVMLAGCDRSSPVTDAAVPPAPSIARTTQTFRHIRHGAAEWIVFDLDLKKVDLSLVGQGPDEPHSLAGVESFVVKRKRELVMATNAGIFDPSRRPMGLHVQHEKELMPLSTADGEGNFFLKPNGVFWIDELGPHVAATENYSPRGKIELATQSGPLLLAAGRIHPAFVESSTSLRTRSGVGVDRRGHVFFVLSKDRVTFHATAKLFRDVLGCADALYLDGEISAISAPGLPPADFHEYGGLLIATARR